MPSHEPLPASAYDAQWRRLADFVTYNPGARHRRRLALRMLNGIRVASVLDVGCGPGTLLQALRKRYGPGIAYAGADFANDTVAVARARLPWARMFELDITRGHLDDQFDLVTCCEVLEHLDDQVSAMKNLAAMVRPGGHLLITCPTGPIYTTERSFGHIHHPTVDEMSRFGRVSGLETIGARTWGWPAYATLKMLTNIRPGLALGQFASGDYGPVRRLISHMTYWATFISWPSRFACQLFWLYRAPA